MTQERPKTSKQFNEEHDGGYIMLGNVLIILACVLILLMLAAAIYVYLNR